MPLGHAIHIFTAPVSTLGCCYQTVGTVTSMAPNARSAAAHTVKCRISFKICNSNTQLKILYTNIFINNLQSICTDKLYLE